MLDALCFETYLLGMFKLRWKGDCKKAFRFSITCNCVANMDSYIGEVLGYANSGSSDIAVAKIEEIKTFVQVKSLQMLPIDAKRTSEDEKDQTDAMNGLIAIIEEDPKAYDAMLSLADYYLSLGKWQSALLLMQQCVEKETLLCSKNLELRMKWATILYFNGYMRLAHEIFSDYALGTLQADAHEYYCGIAANILYETGTFTFPS